MIKIIRFRDGVIVYLTGPGSHYFLAEPGQSLVLNPDGDKLIDYSFKESKLTYPEWKRKYEQEKLFTTRAGVK